MALSKTSFNYHTKVYALIRKPLWLTPLQLGYDEANGFQFQFPGSREMAVAIKACSVLNVLARVGTMAFMISFVLLVDGVELVDVFVTGLGQGVNGLSIIILTAGIVKPIVMMVRASLNGMYLFNRKLAAHFNLPEFPERDGLETLLKGLKWLTIQTSIAIPAAALIAIEMFKSVNFAIEIANLVTRYRFIPIALGLLGSTYLYLGDLLLNVMNVLNIFISTNFMLQWLRIHGESECQSDQENRDRQILYRAHQVFALFQQEFSGGLVPLFVALTCIMSISAFTAAIKFGPTLGLMITCTIVGIGFASLVVQKVTIDIVNKITGASQQYIDQGRDLANRNGNLVDQRFFRACQPIRWNLAVIPVDETLFLAILDSVIVAKIVEFLMLSDESSY